MSKNNLKKILKKNRIQKISRMIYINLHIINQRYSKKKRFYSKKFMSQRSILTSHLHVFYILRKKKRSIFLISFLFLCILLAFLLTSFKQVTTTII